MRIFKILSKLLLILIAFSCEEVIDVDLQDAKPRIVIDATLIAPKGECTVSITNTTDFYMKTPISKKLGATIKLTNLNSNETVELTEKVDSTYFAYVNIEYDVEYKLEVEYNNESYSSISYLKKIVPIDSIRFEELDFFGEKEIYSYAYFIDIKGEENFYRYKIYKNDTTDFDKYTILKDYNQDGECIKRTLYKGNRRRGEDDEDSDQLEIGDEVKVELYSINKETYTYFDMLADVLTSSGREPEVPANPISNWTNNALGCFRAMSVNEIIETITEENLIKREF